MKCGIVGLPNVGKSTFFNFISNSKARSDNFPFSTIEPNYGYTIVPDNRLIKLKMLINSIKIIPSEIKIVDIAGLIQGSHEGNGLGNKFLSNIRETNVIIHIIRCFKDIKIIHVENNINPIRDKEIIDLELQLKDLETIENKINKLKKHQKLYVNRQDLLYTLNKIHLFLQQGKNIRMFPFKQNEIDDIQDLHLLTLKPVIYVANANQHEDDDLKYLQKVTEKEQAPFISLSLHEKKQYLYQSKINDLIKMVYKLFNLQCFFTIGKKEIRSWSIPNNWTTYQASSKIHTDLKKGFICAEVIHYNDFIKYKSENKVKQVGKKLLVGKNYIIQDGDIIKFIFNK
ncbi:redox-regulated ATPase YchF [Blattabacterium cuenoti]|uniref:redox-regulated ATPase YchF n=1 Tax=Blattabacterium cuenoti TaxID=1653831 RepID=UPI00163D0661|nr:DUF933 domain-containing protein [Blattabacterium cuenoti]